MKDSCEPSAAESDATERVEGPAANKKRKLFNSVAEENSGRSSRAAVISSYYKSPSIQISAERLSSTEPLTSRELIGHHSNEAINAVEFSDDSSLFVSGGDDGRVLLWPTSKAVDEKWTPRPFVMDTVIANGDITASVYCLAVSPDNGYIFSGGQDNKLSIHDVNT